LRSCRKHDSLTEPRPLGSGPGRPSVLSLLITLALATALRANLSEWVQNLAVDTGLRGIFFRSMALPYGAIDRRRPPRETRPALTERIAAAPKDAYLYRLRAGEDELALDFAAAEADWKTYSTLASDGMALADYYHRRLQTPQELAALDVVATPAAFERAIKLAEDQGLPETSVIDQYRAWIAKFPKDAELDKRYIRYLVDHAQFAAADREIQSYRAAFPDDEGIWVEEVGLTLKRGSVDQAIAIFDKAFRPLMPADWLKGYFDLLNGQGRLRDFLSNARAAAAAQPESLDPVAREFHYYQNGKNATAARRVLLEYRARKKTWTADELYDTGQLFEDVEEWDEAARQYYALYSLPAADDAAREHGLSALARLLLNAPEKPIHFGAGDLSLYKDIATMDAHAGFLNGILSLVLNGESPRWQYESENQTSVAYFHRARASQLLDLLDARFPHAKEAPSLHASLIGAYEQYGDDDGVVRAGRKFLATYPQSFEHYSVALTMASSFARQRRVADEQAVYDSLLKELAGNDTLKLQYEQVFDRYVTRLVELKRTNDALALYRHEIDRNPRDQALYERLAAFLDQRGLGAQVEQVYKEAAAKFPDSGWQQKLARWYLRLRRNRDFAELTRQVAEIFSGTGLEKYFREIVAPASLDAALTRQVNLYAHQRFPDNLTFVKNLLAVYSRRETADPAARLALLHTYWFYDPQLRAQLFEQMSNAGTLDRDLSAARNGDAKTNPAASEFLAEGEAWRGHYEAAAPQFRVLASDFPGDTALTLRASTLERSLGRTENAVTFARDISQAEPRDRDALARIGDTLADRELFTRARPYWNRIPQIEAGKPDGYLEAATIFWDYYKYDDALRLIGEARTRFHQPDLYSYEAGAIYEGKRDYAAAIRQYVLGARDDSPAEARLLALAKRPRYRAIVDTASATAPLRLRVSVLEAEQRSADIAALLRRAAATETSAGTLDFIESTAARYELPAIQEAAAERQIAISRDPIDRIRLRLALMRIEEAHGAITAARQTVSGIVHDNPTSLGVVRAATDFYWRNKLSAEAIATLTAAAAKANASYRGEFTYEAARKSTEVRQFAEARQMLAPLLTADPFNARYLAAMADTYAQAADDNGLRDFYVAAINSMKQAPLTPDERNTRIAALRRGLIPALTRMSNFSGAVDEYMELINHYPEDDGLIHEAATYAARHSLSPRLSDYYTKAAADSPKDYRWPMVSARLQTNFENFDAAIAAYTAALKIRPDRTDLYASRGALEERLMRFSEAEKTYSALWDLSYRDAHWLDKVAELQAREQKPDAAVATLRKAYLEGRPERADLLLAIAARLESWGLINRAADFARRAGERDLSKEDTATYARVMTRARQYDIALDKLFQDRRYALTSMADTVGRYYTPEEKAAFAAELEKRLGGNPETYWIDIARRAEAFDPEAKWLQAEAAQQGQAWQLIQLQDSRMRFEELGHQLETLAARAPEGPDRTALLTQAADAYTSIGDAASLDRIFGQVPETRRYLEILARGDPSKLLRWAGQRDDAADLAVASGNSTVALAAIAARGQHQPPIWTRAYTALASLYYWDSAPDASPVFAQALGGGTIGERLGKTVDHDRQFAGSAWFYYGARYGEYLSLKKSAQAEDYLPSALEESPGNSAAYSDLADWYVERSQPARAFTEYDHALELDPTRGAVHDRIALLYWDQGKHAEAVAQWRQAIAQFEAQQGRPNLANSFWPECNAALEHIGQHGVAADLQPAVDSLLHSYIVRHARYRSDPLIAPIAKYRLVDFANQPFEVLEQFTDDRDLTSTDRIAVLRRVLYLNQQQPPEQRNDWMLDVWRQQLASLLLDNGDLAGARALLASVPQTHRGQFLELELRIGAKAGELASLLENYRRNPKDAPGFDALRNAAEPFAHRHEDSIADQILAFAYARELDNGNFSASNFLGLAEIRLKANDIPGAAQLLRRMQLVADQPFEDLLPAADLLEKYGHKTEAAEYVESRVRAVPWDAEARLRLGRDLNAIAADADAPYVIRVEAAKRGGTGGAGELALLARGHITAAEANQPFYYEARLAAARNAADPSARVKLLLDAIAVHPETHLLDLFQAANRSGKFELAIAAALQIREALPFAEAREVATAFERAGDYGLAQATLERSQSLEVSPQIHEQLKQEIAAVEQRSAIHQQNENRRPHVSDALVQDHVVRPRIEQ
jgi:cellulose synthase operon protein C